MSASLPSQRGSQLAPTGGQVAGDRVAANRIASHGSRAVAHTVVGAQPTG